MKWSCTNFVNKEGGRQQSESAQVLHLPPPLKARRNFFSFPGRLDIWPCSRARYPREAIYQEKVGGVKWVHQPCLLSLFLRKSERSRSAYTKWLSVRIRGGVALLIIPKNAGDGLFSSSLEDNFFLTHPVRSVRTIFISHYWLNDFRSFVVEART